MSDILETLTGDVDQPTASTGHGSAMSATVVDKRDVPDVNPFAPAAVDEPSTTRPDPPLIPAAVARPVPTIPAFGRIIDAKTHTIVAGTTQPVRIGLQPSRMQGAQLAYMMILVTGGEFSIAGDESAMTGNRATFPDGAALTLEHVGGAYVWGNATTDVTVAVLVTGV